ncbi:MAG: dienelactone hydrolase family protein [Gemmatimonadetes bacterium]|nr:dienelactone hydrolase family protein [Gemmatimonadota bacterium]
MNGPHQGQPLHAAGAPLRDAGAVMVMIHGRGATAPSILSLASMLDRDAFAYLAPQAAGNVWYPYSFLAPVADNEPGISSAMEAIRSTLALAEEKGTPPERVVLLGFSQGACLATEFAARHARRYGAVVGLSGGLIGDDDTPRDYQGSLDGTPVFLGCSDIDQHIPRHRVELSAEILRGLGGGVDMQIYPGMAHTVNQDEITRVQALMDAVLSGG